MSRKVKKIKHVKPMKDPRTAGIQISIKDELEKDKKIKPEKIFEGYKLSKGKGK